MKKLFSLLILALSLIGFNSSVHAVKEGAQSTDNGKETTTEEKKKKKAAEEDEEPECD